MLFFPIVDSICRSYLHANAGAFAQYRFDGESAADHLHPLAHSEDPKTFAPSCEKYAVHVKRLAVVAYFHAYGAILYLNGHLRLAGLRMLCDIGKCFLCNTIEHGSFDIAQLFNLAEDIAEANNVAEKNPEKVSEMEALLEKIREQGKTLKACTLAELDVIWDAIKADERAARA